MTVVTVLQYVNFAYADCNKSLQRCACVATNRCNGALVLQQIVAMVRSCCKKPLHQIVATCFMLQRFDATECHCSIICCNVCVATHLTVNDATRLDGSCRVLLQQTYTPGTACLSILWEFVQIQACICFWSMSSHCFHSASKFYAIFA